MSTPYVRRGRRHPERRVARFCRDDPESRAQIAREDVATVRRDSHCRYLSRLAKGRARFYVEWGRIGRVDHGKCPRSVVGHKNIAGRNAQAVRSGAGGNRGGNELKGRGSAKDCYRVIARIDDENVFTVG